MCYKKEIGRALSLRDMIMRPFFINLGIQDHVVYLDKSEYNIYSHRYFGRAPGGVRVRRQVVGNRGENVNITLAISPEM